MTYFKKRRIKEGFHHIFQRRRKLLLCLLVIREGFHTVQEGFPLENSKKDQRREKDQHPWARGHLGIDFDAHD